MTVDQRGPHAPASMKASATRGVGWTASSRLIIQVLQFASTIVLARLLTPDEYGLVAIVLVFTGFAWLFTELGLGAVIIHREKLDDALVTTAFWLNAISGLVLTGLFCGLAGLIATLYDRPQLMWLVMLGSVGFSLSLSTVHLALLERSMRFKLIAANEVSAVTVSIMVTIVGAAVGLGSYSLVIGSLAQTVMTTALMWRATKWLPRGFLRWTSVKEIWAYSSHLFGFNVINYWSRNADNLLVGKVAGAAALGLYARAYNLMMLPVAQVTTALGRVLFPTMSRLRNDHARLREGYLRAVVVMAAIATPIAVLLSAAAESFIEVVYGQRWSAVAPILAVLAASAPAQIVSGTFGPIYQAIGRTDRLFRRGLVSSAVTVTAILVGLQWGVQGVAVALLIKFWLLVPYSARGCFPLIGLRLRDLLRRVAPIGLAGGGMWGVAWACSHAVAEYPPIAVLTVQGVAGLVVYFGLLSVFGRDAIREVVGLRSTRRPVGRHAAAKI